MEALGSCVIPDTILGWYLGVSLWSERWDKYHHEANEDITVISVVSVI